MKKGPIKARLLYFEPNRCIEYFYEQFNKYGDYWNKKRNYERR